MDSDDYIPKINLTKKTYGLSKRRGAVWDNQSYV
nr:MAG TPA: hypothetical protein [Caudoviricetes sp.]